MHFLQSIDRFERLTDLVRLSHASDGLDIHQRPALPGHSVEEMAASLPRLSEVVVADLSEVVEPNIPRVASHIIQCSIHL